MTVQTAHPNDQAQAAAGTAPGNAEAVSSERQNCEMKPAGLPPVSYELRLAKSGLDGAVSVANFSDPARFSTAPPAPEKEALKRKVAEKLIAHNPQLQLYQFPHEQIAHFERISPEESRRKYRHVELSCPEGGNGVHLVLSDDGAWLTVPFWHEQERAGAAFSELWSYLEIIRQEAGYEIYDPQVRRTLDPVAGREEALARYQETARQVREALVVSGKPVEQPQLSGSASRNGSEEARGPVIRELAGPQDAGVVLVAVSETGAVCGFAEVSVNRHRPKPGTRGPVAWLESWYVAPGFRDRGFDRRLLEQAEQWAARRGFSELVTELKAADEPARQAYLAHGFTEDRRTVRLTKPLQAAATPQRPLSVLPGPSITRNSASRSESAPTNTSRGNFR